MQDSHIGGLKYLKLDVWEELCTTLDHVEKGDGFTVAEFVTKYPIILPAEAFEKLEGLQGSKVGLLRVDDLEYRYKCPEKLKTFGTIKADP